MSAHPAIRITGLTKSFGARRALDGVNLEVMPGEMVALIGASGSGKSTLLAILAGLDTPSSGSVELDGADLFALDEDARAELRGRTLGFVFQSFQLLPALNALENVMLPLELSGAKDPETPAREILGRVGLAERLHHYPKHLSGGEQQRVALARAFVVRPKVLLADEQTGSLDAASGVQAAVYVYGGVVNGVPPPPVDCEPDVPLKRLFVEVM